MTKTAVSAMPTSLMAATTGWADAPLSGTKAGSWAAWDASAQKSGKNVLYTKGLWKWIMLTIKNIPEWKFNRMSI